MRLLLKASIPAEVGNASAKDGTLGKKMHSILADLKPEAGYFTDMDGQRTALVFLNVEESSEIPKIAEPWMLAFNANIELHPVMIPEDLMKAGPDIGEAVKKYG